METLVAYLTDLLYEIDPHQGLYQEKRVVISYRDGESLQPLYLYDDGRNDSVKIEFRPHLVVEGARLGPEKIAQHVRVEIPLDDIMSVLIKGRMDIDFDEEYETTRWLRNARGQLERFHEEA